MPTILAGANSFTTADDYIFEKIYLEKNTSFGIVEDIYQDKYGFIWIGTKDGLYRYDGIEFKEYFFDREDTNSLSNNVVMGIFGDRHNNMWVATENGLNLYNEKMDDFRRFFHDTLNPASVGSDYITGIGEDREGTLWFATFDNGVCSYNIDKGTFHQYSAKSLGLPSKKLRTLYIDPEGNIWLGTEDKGACFFKPGEKATLIPPGKMDGRSLSGSTVNAIIEGPDGRIWLGTNGQGISCYDPQSRQITYYTNIPKDKSSLGGNIIISFYIDSRNNLWICTDDGGLSLFLREQHAFRVFRKDENLKNHISSNAVRCFFEDKAGNYWIGNFDAPINYIDTHRKKFSNITHNPMNKNSLADDQVTSVLVDSRGLLWIGTDGGGLDAYDPSSDHYKLYTHIAGNRNSLTNNKPLSLAEDKKGRIWIGYFDGGLSCLDPVKNIFTQYYPDGTNNNPRGTQIWDMLMDGDSLWLATEKGLDILDIPTGHFTFVPVADDGTGTGSEGCWSILKDSHGRILVGTIDGLDVYYPDEKRFAYFRSDMSNPKSLSDKWVFSLFEDTRHRIWVGTNGGGLDLWNEKDSSFRHFGTRDGLAGNLVNNMLEDSDGFIWISTNNGLSRFNPDNLNFENFDLSDGIQGNRFSKNAAYKDLSGVMYFGGTRGLTYFVPSQIHPNNYVPPVVFIGFKLFNKGVYCHDPGSPLKENIVLQKKIVLSDEDKVFSIQFAALNYTRPSENHYKYKLEPFEKDWNDVGNVTEATYTSLPPGEYTFRVMASNNDLVWNTEGNSLNIVIEPPFYKTWWFIFIIGFFLTGLAILAFRIRVRNTRIDNLRLSRLVSERTSELEDRHKEIIMQNEEILRQRDLATEQRDQIINQNTELEMHRKKLSVLVEERTRELIQAKEKAEQSDKMKTAFLENLSHEIRTPLNSILGFINLLMEKNDDERSRNYYLRIINDSGRNLLRLIEDIIDFSRIQSGSLKPEYSPCSVSDIIRELITQYRDRALREKPDLNIMAELPDEDRNILTDERKLKQIFSKLLENSIKYTDAGYIRLGVKEINRNFLTFFVEDTGKTIAPEEKDMVFERFLKVEGDNPHRTFRGSGLGLALAKQLTETLGGTIWTENENEKGLKFCFTIPFVDGSFQKSMEKGQKPRSRYYWPGKKILVAEDEESNYLLIEAIFRDSGVEILHAHDGVEFLDILDKNEKIDLVLLDIKMPRMDGLNAIKIVRDSQQNVPVIAQTAFDNTYHREKCIEMGCNDFLTKPLRKEELLKIVRKYLDETETVTGAS